MMLQIDAAQERSEQRRELLRCLSLPMSYLRVTYAYDEVSIAVEGSRTDHCFTSADASTAEDRELNSFFMSHCFEVFTFYETLAGDSVLTVDSAECN